MLLFSISKDVCQTLILLHLPLPALLSTVGLKKRYFTSFYVFKCYDNNDVFFQCEVLVCPQDWSSNCAALSCTKKGYFTSFYVFKCYDNNDVFFQCEVLVCPQDWSSNCAALSCTKKRRSIPNAILANGSRYFEASKLLHITSPGSGTTAVLGCFGLVLLPAIILLQ